MTEPDIAFLTDLERIIAERISRDEDESYTARLARTGAKRVAQKVGEEAVELVLASAAGDRDEQIDESADLLYHLLVLSAVKDIGLAEIVGRLQLRHHSR